MAKIDRETLKAAVRDHAENLCNHYFPRGNKLSNQWVIGNVNGDPGQSLRIELEGEKAGVYHDFASGEGGDFIELVMHMTGRPFVDVAREIGSITGTNVEEAATSYSGKGSRYKASASVKPCNWDGDYRLSIADIDELICWRGYSREFCQWAATERLIGRRDGNWAFPVHDSGSIIAAHVRLSKDQWAYRPKLKDLGLSVSPLIAGEPTTAEKVFSDESPWDIFAVLDKLGIQHGEAIAGIATRGAANAALVATIQVKAELYAIPQNDDPGRGWVESLGTVLSREFKVIAVPSSFHDVNDWLKALGDIGEFVEAIRNAVSREPQNRQTEAERTKLFSRSTISGASFANINIPPKQIIIEDWLREANTVFIFAYRGIGKTWLTLSLCVSIAEGVLFGPWSVPIAYPVLYVDGEMTYDDVKTRIIALGGKIPEKLHILQHEVLFQKGGDIINLANRVDQKILLEICLQRNIKVLVLDNLSCLFCGVGENKADEWEKVKLWLLELHRHNIAPVVIHHTGIDQSRMRGTTAREDDASTVMRLDNKKEDFAQTGAHFITRLTKHRGKLPILDYEWKFEPDNDLVKITIGPASRDEVFLQWVMDGLTRCEDIAKEMGISKGRASQIATKLMKLGKLRKKGREYEAM